VHALRLLEAKILYKAIRSASRNQLCETFEWQSGFYQWEQPADDAEGTAKPHDILSLFQEQLPRRWGSERLFQALMPNSECYGDISPRFRRVAEKLARTGEHAKRVIARLDGTVTLGQILGECAGDPLAAATLWTLLHTGILRVRDKQQYGQTDAGALEFEVEVLNLAGSPGKGATSSSPAAAEAASSKKDDQREALRSQILTLLERLPDLDHYDALGLTSEANPAEIKRAYFTAAKRFHPDVLARLGLEDLRDEAAQVFGRIAEAFEILSDATKKAAYDTGGSNEPEIDTARLAQAETSFRKGEILVKMGNFAGALEYLRPAVDLWPSEPAYQAGLGWALYKQPGSDMAGAREHLEIASSLAPDDAVIMFRLGNVVGALGEARTAELLITRAREIDPSLEE